MDDLNRPRKKREQGVAGLIAIAMMVVLLALAAFVVDGGLALKSRSELDNALDAAVLAGAQELPDTTKALTLAQQFLALNQSQVSLLDTPQVTFTFPADDLIKATGTVSMTTVLAGVVGMSDITVGSLSTAQRVDPDLVLLFDKSGSMCRDSHGFQVICPDDGIPWQPFTKVQNAAKLFVDKMPTGARIALVSYSTSATLDRLLSSDKGLIKATIDAMVPGGFTDITGALGAGTTELIDNAIPGRAPIVVLLTDGLATSVNGTITPPGPGANDPALAAAQIAADEGMILFTIAFGDDADPIFLAQLADLTEGGEFFPAPNPGQLIQAFLTIADLAYVRLIEVG